MYPTTMLVVGIRTVETAFLTYPNSLGSLSFPPWWDGNGRTAGPSQYKDGLSNYGDLHLKDKMVMRPSYLKHGIPILGRWHLYIETHPGSTCNPLVVRTSQTMPHEVRGTDSGSNHHIGWHHFHLTPHGAWYGLPLLLIFSSFYWVRVKSASLTTAWASCLDLGSRGGLSQANIGEVEHIAKFPLCVQLKGWLETSQGTCQCLWPTMELCGWGY